ncbi:MAG: C39 family peptidase [Deltaproteobacteria bacterium]
MKRFRLITVLVAACLLALSGCGPRRAAVLKALNQGRARGVLIKGVPGFIQDKFMCGPASLASVMSFYGEQTGPDEIAQTAYLEGLKGTLMIDLLLYAKSKGFNASYYRGGIADLKEKLRDGKPLILFLNTGYGLTAKGHYITVFGYSDSADAVVAHTGIEKEAVLGYKELVSTWKTTNFSTLLITPRAER